MKFLSFTDLQTELRDRFSLGEFADALELAAQASPDFPEQAHILFYWRITLAASMGDEAQALRLLKEVLETGFWYGEALLRKNSSLASLQGHPEFEQLLALNRRLQDQDAARLFPLLTLRQQGQCKAGGPPCPLLLVLHPNASTAQASVEFWRTAASLGWIVAAPQSTQVMWKGAYVWDDRETTEREIKKDFASLVDQYAVDSQRIVLGGVGVGGEMAAWLALAGSVPAAGFIAFGPSGALMEDPEAWLPLIQESQNDGLRAYIIVGDEDESVNFENIQALADMLNDGGIPCDLEEVPHAGSEFVPEFEESLQRGIEFILHG